MKSLLLLPLLFIALSSSAQVWIDQNANWHYDYWNIGYSGFYDMEYVQDTVIGGQLCQQIETTQYKFTTDQFGVWHQLNTYSHPTQFTYVNSDTVFYWNDNQFFTLFNFGADIGDQWLIGISDPYSGGFSCHDSSFVEVTDTGSVNINSVNYHTITLTTLDSSSLGLEGTYVERFGFIDSNTPFQPFPRGMNCDNGVVVEWDYVTFKCFEDDSFSMYNPSGEDCEFLLTHLSLENKKPSKLQFFPNPTTDIVNVISDHSGTLQIIDCTGKLVQFYNILHSETIDLSSLENGIYIAVFRSNSGAIVRKRILKNS